MGCFLFIAGGGGGGVFDVSFLFHCNDCIFVWSRNLGCVRFDNRQLNNYALLICGLALCACD